MFIDLIEYTVYIISISTVEYLRNTIKEYENNIYYDLYNITFQTVFTVIKKSLSNFLYQIPTNSRYFIFVNVKHDSEENITNNFMHNLVISHYFCKFLISRLFIYEY